MLSKRTLRVALCLVCAAVAAALGGCVVVPYDGDGGYRGHREGHWGDHDRDERRWH